MQLIHFSKVIVNIPFYRSNLKFLMINLMTSHLDLFLNIQLYIVQNIPNNNIVSSSYVFIYRKIMINF